MKFAATCRKRAPSSGRTSPSLAVGLMLGCLAFLLVLTPGCTRRFFRQRADNDVAVILAEKEDPAQWPLINYWIYPHPYARFADLWGNPDRPPMPPDDPGAWLLAPRPQRPKVVLQLEGTGYLDILAEYDAANRAIQKAEAEAASKPPSPDAPPPPEPTPSKTTLVGGEQFRRTEPYIISLDQALELAVFNSREFQASRENLYIAALPVSLQRFNFLPQFLAVQNAVREWSTQRFPGGPTNEGNINSTAGVRQLFGSGALLLLRIANQTVIDFTQNGRPTFSQSNLILNLSQPLLAGGGRAATLEPLTQSERDLLYEVRRFNRFNREFYVNIAAGQSIASGFGGGGFGLPVLRGQAAAVGYLPTLQRLAAVEVERANVDSLSRLFRFFQAFAEGGGYSQLQVDQVEQQLNDARVTLLARQLTYQDNLDQFKIQLGVPTDLPLELDFNPLRDMKEQILRLQELEESYRQTVMALEKEQNNPQGQQQIRAIINRLIRESPLTDGTDMLQRFESAWGRCSALNHPAAVPAGLFADAATAIMQMGQGTPLALLAQVSATRRPPLWVELQLRRLERERLLDEQDNAEMRDQPLSVEKRQRLRLINESIEIAELELALNLYERLPFNPASAEGRDKIIGGELYRRIVTWFSLVLESGRVEQQGRLNQKWPELPPLRVNGVDLLAVPLDQAQNLVGQVALANRLDLMNQRAQVVDAWRRIAVQANSLMGVFDLGYNLNVQTPPLGGQPFNFKGTIAQHQLTFNTELPLVRRLERNNYRASLIAFQRARRNLQATEDQILFQVRQSIRQLRQFAESYKIQQRSLQLAYSQVDNAFEVLRAPPAVGQGAQQDSASAAAALTTQLLQAQRSLPQAQNALYQTWVNFITTRMELYRDLELMQIDARGAWINERALDAAPGRDEPRPAGDGRAEEPARPPR